MKTLAPTSKQPLTLKVGVAKYILRLTSVTCALPATREKNLPSLEQSMDEAFKVNLNHRLSKLRRALGKVIHWPEHSCSPQFSGFYKTILANHKMPPFCPHH